MSRRLIPLVALFAFTSFALIHAAEMKAHLDCSANVKYLKTHFRAHGMIAPGTVTYENENEFKGIRFWLESATKEQKRTDLYSVFTLVGDFEVSVQYDWRTVSIPKEGYGVTCGISVEVETERKMVALARGFQVGKGDGFITTEKKYDGKEPKYHTDHEATKARKGRLVLRREKDKVICLASEDNGELKELKTIPFTRASVHKVHLFADPGNVSNALDARLLDIQVRAEEILSDIPLRERESTLGWWLMGGVLVLFAIAGYVGYRRWRDDKWLWSRAER